MLTILAFIYVFYRMSFCTNIFVMIIKNNCTWPLQEAQALLKNINNVAPKKGYILFETGYGPSGLPHIGTFAEVIRTSMVRKAISNISNIPTKLFCISDDMDGLRKIPENIPNKEKFQHYIGVSLTNVPDPYKKCSSYGAYMNLQLKRFLDYCGCNYDFISATEYYKKGKFNEYLKKVLYNYDLIMKEILPTLSLDRRFTYSPFLPICPITGQVLQVKVMSYDIKHHTITYINDNKQFITTTILDGGCKLQWKVDFAMRWAALDVNYEIYGKDIQANAYLYNKICKILGKTPPQQMFYEFFLDQNGQKISKSQGNGFTVRKWLKYSTIEALKLFMYQTPKKAKKISFQVIPKIYDELLEYYATVRNNQKQLLLSYSKVTFILEDLSQKLDLKNITFSILLNLIAACNMSDRNVIYGYLNKTASEFDIVSQNFFDRMLDSAISYYHDFIQPIKQYNTPDEHDLILLMELNAHIKIMKLQKDITAEKIQNLIFRLVKKNAKETRDCFQAIYKILLGTSTGPKLGSFFYLYSINKIQKLIRQRLQLKRK